MKNIRTPKPLKRLTQNFTRMITLAMSPVTRMSNSKLLPQWGTRQAAEVGLLLLHNFSILLCDRSFAHFPTPPFGTLAIL